MKEITAFRKYLNEGLDKKPQIEENYEPGSIAPTDLYYSDKHGSLVAMGDVDDKYHDSLELVYKKGDKIEDIDDEGGEGEGYYDRYPSGMAAPEDLYYSEKQSRLVAKGDKDRPIEDDDELELYYRKGEKIREVDTHSEDEDVASNFKEGKMTKQALKEKIKAEILSTLSEADDDDERDKNTYFGADAKDKIKQRREKAVDFLQKHKEKYGLKEDEDEDVDVEDVDVDIDVEAPAETSSEPGLTSDEMEIQNSLKRAYDTAVSIGDEKLSNQIANSITFFTKTHVVPRD